jgi:hypothetical protein
MERVKDLSIEELKALVGEIVEDKLREILADPDAGLVLRPEIRERLLRDLEEPQQEGQNIPAAELARRRGMEW